jgi:hypothetical protein
VLGLRAPACNMNALCGAWHISSLVQGNGSQELAAVRGADHACHCFAVVTPGSINHGHMWGRALYLARALRVSATLHRS